MAFQTAAMTPLRILLVEDDALIGPLLAELLEAMGHLVCDIEATEAGAVRAALRDKPDLMIVDARLHEGSGIDAVNTVRLTSDIPYIFMSGGALPASCDGAVKLQKPFMGRDLVNAIMDAMKQPGAGLN
jgi:DNA-binding response OmpR family regulator